ncbi:prokaryotic type I DNA topoisomerase [Gautieria morchelliformis]|nr:prokaryotic type I DNA topoisomerase [Gautieria morchelliformis]
MHVLCVAEKPSIAKSVSQILSGGQFATRTTQNKYIKNYDFAYPRTRDTYTVTSVSGHLMFSDFGPMHRSWTSCDPLILFEAPVETKVAEDKKSIERNLISEARKSQMLMIWTDCDREGENIGMEVAKVCRKANNNIRVKRAKFSAIIAQQIHHAAQNPVELDKAQADAVDARTILDLRLGAAFTRMQSLILQPRFGELGQQTISYGPCQFPTLGFVVSRYEQVKSFSPEPFWYIYLALGRSSDSKMSDDTGEATEFTWRRGRLFDFDVSLAIYEGVVNNPTARVTSVTQKPTKKWKPLPLTTVELQKSGSRLLKLAPKKILDVAEKLYQQGFLSYPRTETDQFDVQFDFMALIQKQSVDPSWGPFATNLQEGGFGLPRKGKKNDQAHPPIHPTAHAANLTGDEKRVYEYITRRFLACCSKDAEGWETTVDAVCGGDEFFATGLQVIHRNYLDVFPYDKWNGKHIPDFDEGEEFMPSVCELKEGLTTRPTLLTEADLVGLMDKNGIGTDATIAQHIQTIIDREYVIERMEGSTKYLVPSTLGIGLIEGYNKIGFEKSLSKPQLRREVSSAEYLLSPFTLHFS